MGKLTNNYEGCNQIILCGNETCKETCEKNQCCSCPINKAIDKLATYEDIIDDPEKLKIIDELYLERCEEINRLKAELAEKEEEFCEWEVWDEEANCYHTSCENAHFFVDGSPKDNKYVFCPYCGRKLKEVQA